MSDVKGRGGFGGWAIGLVVLVVLLVAGVLFLKDGNVDNGDDMPPVTTTDETPVEPVDEPVEEPTNTGDITPAPDTMPSTAAGPAPETIASTAIGDSPLSLIITVLGVGGAGYAGWNLWVSKKAVKESLLK